MYVAAHTSRSKPCDLAQASTTRGRSRQTRGCETKWSDVVLQTHLFDLILLGHLHQSSQAQFRVFYTTLLVPHLRLCRAPRWTLHNHDRMDTRLQLACSCIVACLSLFRLSQWQLVRRLGRGTVRSMPEADPCSDDIGMIPILLLHEAHTHTGRADMLVSPPVNLKSGMARIPSSKRVVSVYHGPFLKYNTSFGKCFAVVPCDLLHLSLT